MPIVIDGYDLLVRNRTLETRYPTGVAGFAADAGKSRFCTDRVLSKAAFDTRAEAIAFAQFLRRRGLISHLGDLAEDYTILTKNLHFLGRCTWVMPGMYNRIPIAWSPTNRPSMIAVSPSWQKSREPWFPPPEMDSAEVARRMKFIRRDGPHEIFLDTQTNQETRLIYVSGS